MVHAPDGSPLEPGYFDPYPYPRLTRSGERGLADFRVATVSNDLVTVTVLPDLGGRILSVVERSTGTHAWPLPESLRLEGLVWPVGVCLCHRGLSAVSFAPIETQDEQGRGGVFCGWEEDGCRWTVSTTLVPGSGSVLIEARVFNSLLHPVERALSCFVGADRVLEFAGGVTLEQSGRAIATLTIDEDPGISFQTAPDAETTKRFIGPRRTLAFDCSLTPLFGWSASPATRASFTVGWRGQTLEAAKDGEPEGVKLVAFLQGGASMECPVSLGSDELFSAELPQNIASVAVVRTGGERVLFEPPSERRAPDPVLTSRVEEALLAQAPGSPEHEFFRSVIQGLAPAQAVYGLEHVRLWLMAATSPSLAAADRFLDDALAFNGEDPLLWWFKAVVRRRSATDDEERGEWLNARYLSPLEPALRAEAFLCGRPADTPDPSPLVRPLIEDPSALLGVLGLYLSIKQTDDFVRLVSEVRKGTVPPLVQLVYAHFLLKSSPYAAEAADLVRAATEQGMSPPFPVRDWERRAVQELARLFPEDQALQAWACLARL